MHSLFRPLRLSFGVWLGLVCATELALSDDDPLRVLPVPRDTDRVPSALYTQLQGRARAALEVRRAAYENVKTPDDVARWQNERRSMFLRMLGTFPEHGPLHARVTRTLTGDGFRVENILFESRPRHHVTGNLYVPLTQPPYPAVIVPCGHSFNGKSADGYQRVCMLLARNGIAAFCYDPIGQGERYQTFSPDQRPLGHDYTGAANSVRQLEEIPGNPRFNPVEEHTLIGIGSILVGTNTAQYRVFDGLRAIDYLVSRGDIDPARIGCTGNSGGGTLTAYLMALDERIVCAAPTCYLTSFERLLETAGPQDAEQNLFGQIADGLDQADYVLMRAPRPTLICAGTRDATFDIAGTWDVYREGKRFYSRLGYPERVDLCEADEPHGFTKPLREGVVRWMCRWLLKQDDPVFEPELPVFTAAELQCTPDGQTLFLPDEESVFDFHRKLEVELRSRRRKFWDTTPRGSALGEVRRLVGIASLAEVPVPRREVVETRHCEGYTIEKTLFKSEFLIPMPALDFRPETPNGRVVVYLHSAGKGADATTDGPIVTLARQGVRVLAVDLPGIGELQRRHPRDWGQNLFGPNTQEFFLSYMLGDSLVGIRANSLLSVLRGLGTERADPSQAHCEVVAVGSATGIPALHVAALQPNEVTLLTLQDCLESWSQLLNGVTDGEQLTNVVQAALTVYDLPDLSSRIEPSRLIVVRTRSPE